MKRSSCFLGLAIVLLIVLLGGCQAVFTYSPLSFLQRDPSSLSPEQQAAWAEEALASGDPEAMAQAYELIKDDPAQAYLAASLAAELSGVPEALADAIADMETIMSYSPDELESYLDDFLDSFDATDATYAAEAAALFDSIPPEELTGTDMVMAALCFAFAAAAAEDPESFETADYTDTQAFIDECLLVLPADDPARELLEQFDILGT